MSRGPNGGYPDKHARQANFVKSTSYPKVRRIGMQCPWQDERSDRGSTPMHTPFALPREVKKHC